MGNWCSRKHKILDSNLSVNNSTLLSSIENDSIMTLKTGNEIPSTPKYKNIDLIDKRFDNENDSLSELSDINDSEIKYNDNYKLSSDDDYAHKYQYRSSVIPIQTESIIINNAGWYGINGEYRWFLHTKNWCNFQRNGQSYVLENNYDVNKVKFELNRLNINYVFNDNIKLCWVITNINEKTIYYFAEQKNNTFIPHENTEWICVNGMKPTPNLYKNILNDMTTIFVDDTLKLSRKRSGSESMPIDSLIRTSIKEDINEGNISDLDENFDE